MNLKLLRSLSEISGVSGREEIVTDRENGVRVLPWIAVFRDPWVGLHYRTPPTPLPRSRRKHLSS